MGSTSQPDDRELLEAWRSGDNAAGSKLLRRHFMVITRYFERRVASEHLDDLVQLTFLGCVKSVERVPDGVRFKAYLLGIARNQLLMWIRKKQRGRDAASLDAEKEPLPASIAPSRVVGARHEARVLFSAMRQLPEELLAPVELYYWEELTVAEIALALDQPPGTVKTRLHRARRLLRELIPTLDVPAASRESTMTFLRELHQRNPLPEGGDGGSS